MDDAVLAANEEAEMSDTEAGASSSVTRARDTRGEDFKPPELLLLLGGSFLCFGKRLCRPMSEHGGRRKGSRKTIQLCQGGVQRC
jgi:hypothetical protein